MFEHPYAGIQIPAGTVEEGERPLDAALRETAEETGLTEVKLLAELGARDAPPPEGYLYVSHTTTVYARPDRTSFDWAHLPRAAMVRELRRAAGFIQVEYIEWDQWPACNWVSYCIQGWAPEEALTTNRQRHFYHLTPTGDTEERWTVFTDNHCFSLFWAPLSDLPEIVSPQDRWLDVLYGHLKSSQE